MYAQHKAEISEKDFGAKWPFKEKKGTLECVNNAVIFRANGKIYGVNGLGKSMFKHEKNYVDILKIWKKDPAIPGAKLDISPILEKGKSLCR